MSAKSQSLVLETPSRLHFGLLSFGHTDQRQYGGAGLMIRQPGVKLQARPAERFEVVGCYAERVREFAQFWRIHYDDRELPPCRLQVLEAPRQHTGLGVGTQLGLAVAAMLHAMEGHPCPPPAQLARSVRRGLRSAIGVHGFYGGGLVVERGKLPHEDLSPLDVRIDLPEAWRVVLIFPQVARGKSMGGLSGTSEYRAFATLPAVAPEVTQQLSHELQRHLLPAAAAGDFAAFAESVYRYGYQAGLCFAPVQQGPYHSPDVAKLVDALRRQGVRGVGQSSWGPMLFAFQPDPCGAERLVKLLVQGKFELSQCLITSPCNRGARFSRLADPTPPTPHSEDGLQSRRRGAFSGPLDRA
jgi:beta-ribofuranosylaminobenzene 5'-phosphate synthase